MILIFTTLSIDSQNIDLSRGRLNHSSAVPVLYGEIGDEHIAFLYETDWLYSTRQGQE